MRQDLSQWHDLPAKRAIIDCVERVTDPRSKLFVPPAKPVGLQKQIGRRPLPAFGHFAGGFQMMEWTMPGAGSRLGSTHTS